MVQKKAREIFFRAELPAQDAMDMGMVNVIPHAELEDTAYEWAQEILGKSPMAIKMLKFAMNLTDDGGQQVLQVKPTD
jgi:naphthoate synthase